MGTHLKNRAVQCAVVALSSAAVVAGPPNGPMFTDHTQASGCITTHTPGKQFLFTLMAGGGAIGDFNRDGLQDIFVVNSGGIPDCLFMNNGDGTFTDMAESAGLAELHMGIGAAVGDYDGDGDLDIFVTSMGPADGGHTPGEHRLYRNNGDLSFTNVATEAGVNFTSDVPDGFGATFADVDLDGDLDLYVCTWRLENTGNRLFRNEGDGTFTDITVEAGLFTNTLRGFAPNIIDMDGDRYPEIFATGDFDTSHYWVNNRDGTFTDATAPAGLGLDDNGMGSGVADINNDGLLDWYVSSIWSPVGLPPGVPGTGNMMYINQGEHSYSEVAGDNGTRDGGWGWGIDISDYDHDGRVDIAETNGWTGRSDKGIAEWEDEQSYLFHQQPDGSFVDVAIEAGIDHTLQGRALARLDFDNDGDMDLFIHSAAGEFRLYRNDIDSAPGDHNYLRVFLDTSNNPTIAPDGINSRVIATVDGVPYLRFIDSSSSYLNTKEFSAHFGLAGATTVDELRVEWTNGRVTVLEGVPTNQTITIQAPSLCATDWDTNGVVNANDVGAFITQYFVDLAEGTLVADFDGNGVVNAADIGAFITRYYEDIADPGCAG